MSIDFSRIPRGQRNETNLPKRNGIYLGMVRQNLDFQRMGRLSVFISDFGPDQEEFWLPVSYASPFAGTTPVRDTIENGKTMADSQKSYGFWATPPDIDNQVLCCFLDGDVANGYWFSCVYPQNMNHMVPAIGFDFPTADAAMDAKFAPLGPPVVEYNKHDKANSPNGLDFQTKEKVKRPVFTPLAEGLVKQGLARDPKRGPGNTSARRESPSRAIGLLSPRGNSIHIDDGALPDGGGEPEEEFIRFRTRSGVQILINETDGFIYMITKSGNWIEISDDNIDMYSSGSISLNADQDINIRAGGQVGIHGDQAIRLASATYSSLTSEDTNIVSGKRVMVDAANDIGLKSSRDIALDAVRDVGLNSGRNILEGACGYASRNAKGLLDNAGGAPPPDVDHAYYARNVTSRVPLHEPFDRNSNEFNVNNDGTTTVRRSDGSTVTEPLPISKGQLASIHDLYCKLKAKGLSDVAIAATIGAWQQESTLNTGAKEPNKGGRWGQGIGLAQWSVTLGKHNEVVNQGRRGAFLEYAKSQGKEWTDQGVQIDYFFKEIGPGGIRAKAGQELRAATTLDQANKAMQDYENFGKAGKRVGYAQSVLNLIKSGKLKC